MGTRIHIVLDDDLANRLKALAQQEDRSLSRQVAFMVKQMLNDNPFVPVMPTNSPALQEARYDVPPEPDTPPPPGGPPWYEPQ